MIKYRVCVCPGDIQYTGHYIVRVHVQIHLLNTITKLTTVPDKWEHIRQTTNTFYLCSFFLLFTSHVQE